MTSRVITQTWVLYFHQRYHAATMTPARKSGEGKKRGGECRSNRLHVRRYCYRHAAPLLHVRVGTRRSLASLQARNPALRRLQRGGRPDDVLFFPFPPSPFLTPRTTRGEENSGATLLPPRFSFVRASGPRGTHGHAFLFSFHLVTIRYNYASSYVRTYRQWVSRGDELKSFRGERNETRIPRANRSR